MNNVPDDEKDAPEWMNKEFFEKILRNNDDSVEVTNVIAKPGSNVGDHYASVMFRALITYNTSISKGVEISLIVKTMPFLEGPKKDLLSQNDMFKIEIMMYSEILPMFEKVLKQINDDSQIACKCLYSALEPHQTMVFEDLLVRNFKSPSGFNDQMYLISMKALSKLAKWHAISYKLNADDPNISKNFEKGLYKGYTLEFVPLFRDGFNSFLDMLKSQADFKDYVPKFEKLIDDNVLRKAQHGFNAKEGDGNLMVLNHGDIHLKNTMITENDGEFDVLLIDFQTCYWGPAVIDLVYFLYMSIDAENRSNRRDEIIYTYYKTFSETLSKIGFNGKIPKLTDLYKDFITYKDYELLIITTMLPLVCYGVEKKGDIDPSQVMDNDDFRKTLYSRSIYQSLIKQILPDLLHRGYLD